MADAGHYPEGMNWPRYDAAWSTEPIVSLSDAEDAAALRRTIEYLQGVRTVLRGLPHLATNRTDIYCAGDVDTALEGEIAQLAECVVMLESGED